MSAKITMAHGSGGDTTQKLIADIFQRHFSNPVLDRMEDAAVLPINSKRIAFTTDSFVIHPLFFKGGDIGKLAVCGTVNDLSMMGARPKYLTAGFILEEGLELDTLEQVVASMQNTLDQLGIKVVCGDTKVVEGNGGLYINTAGIGEILTEQTISISNVCEGDVLLVSGSMGNHQAAILSHRMQIENDIESDCAPLWGMVQSLLEVGINIKAMRDITRGGLATVLNEVAEASNVSIEMNETDIPVDEEVKAFADVLGLDPLTMANEGKFLCVVKAEDATRALKILHANPLGNKAQIIGQAVQRQSVKVIMHTRLGGKRVVDRLYGEGLPRIC